MSKLWIISNYIYNVYIYAHLWKNPCCFISSLQKIFRTIFNENFDENTTTPCVWVFIFYRVFSFYFIVIWKISDINFPFKYRCNNELKHNLYTHIYTSYLFFSHFLFHRHTRARAHSHTRICTLYFFPPLPIIDTLGRSRGKTRTHTHSPLFFSLSLS